MERRGVIRPGGRTALTRERVHGAVRQLLLLHPGAPVQMAQVAATSGVNAATLYRRWGTVEALVLDVMVDDLSRQSPLQATGDLREDLLRYARRVRDGVEQPNGLQLLRAASAVGATEGGDAAVEVLLTRRLDEIRVLLDRSRDPSTHDLTPTDVVDGIVGPITYRRMIGTTTRLDEDGLARLVDGVVAAAVARRAPPERSRS